MQKLPIERLDTSRPYGFVSGETGLNIAFEQDGWPYDAHGDLIEAGLHGVQLQVLAEKRQRAAAKLAAQQAKAGAVAADEDDEDKDADPTQAQTTVGNGEDDINLIMWLKGEARYKPHEIQAALKKRYGVNKPRPRDAALYLVEEQRLAAWDEVTLVLRPQQQQ